MICHPCRCIFVHVPRTGGQSIESVFVEHVGLTWETRAPLLLRANDLPEAGPPVLAHLTAEEYIQLGYISEDLFKAYFKFTFVRNPWDRVVSFYHYYGFQEKCDFNYFMNNIFVDRMWGEKFYFVRPQVEYVFNASGEQLVNFIGRFENLGNDFFYILKHLGMAQVELPHKNKALVENQQFNILSWRAWIKNFSRVLRKSHPTFHDYQDYYDNVTSEMVSELYRSDIEQFGYNFLSN